MLFLEFLTPGCLPKGAPESKTPMPAFQAKAAEVGQLLLLAGRGQLLGASYYDRWLFLIRKK